MDDFIVDDGPEVDQGLISGTVKELYGRDRYDMAARDDGEDIQEAGFDEISKEERKSKKIGNLEDRIEEERSRRLGVKM